MDHPFDDDELAVAGDARTQAYFEELERAGVIRRVDWTMPDMLGHVMPVYQRVPEPDIVKEAFDRLEREGKIHRTGEFRNGEPVYATTPLLQKPPRRCDA